MGLAFAGCSENKSAEKVLTQKQSVVFNLFNVDQARGSLAYVEEVNDPIRQQQHAIAILSHRSGAVVAQRACDKVQNSGEDIVERGSGVLTSSRKLITALHVVNNPEKNKIKDKIEVYFGTTKYVGGDPFYSVTGQFPKDEDFELGAIEPEFENGRFSGDEEEPFLAMRLFQLGLHLWSKNSLNAKATRERLRSWTFDYAQGNCAIPKNQYSFKCQGYAFRNESNFQIAGKDIAILKARNQIPTFDSEENVFYFGTNGPMSGAFPLDRPGLFFDHITVGETKVFKGVENNTPLWLQHANAWPDRRSGESTRLISRPGYTLQEFEYAEDIGVRFVENLCGDKAHWLQDTVLTSLDLKAGSSGGMVMAPNIHQFLADGTYDLVTQEMIGIGVAGGSTGAGSYWSDAGPFSIAEPSADIYLGDEHNYYTAILNSAFPSDETDGPLTNLDDPRTCREDETKGCVPSKKFNADGDCIIAKDEPSTYPTGGTFLTYDMARIKLRVPFFREWLWDLWGLAKGRSIMKKA